jgi:uncharacterized protein YqeY
MNTLENKIQADLVTAMKGHQENAVAALRSVKTAIQNEKVSGAYYRELTDNDIVKLIQKLVKQRQESMEIYAQAGRHELADKEQKEMFVLSNYLPKMLSEDELKEIIDRLFTELDVQSMKDMGKVMKALGERYTNLYDGKAASTYIKSKF